MNNIINKWNYKVGDTIGDVTIEDMYKDIHNNLMLKTKCNVCGFEKTMRASGIKSYPNNILHTDMHYPVEKRYPINSIIGDMTIIGYDKDKSNGRILLVCRCNICGKEKTTRPYSINNINEYGYFSHEYCNRQFYNGLAQQHPELYAIWNAMIQRVTNPNSKSYYNYGARGIGTEYDSNNKGFVGFINDMAESYYEHISIYGRENTSLDRIDNNDGYYKYNLRWATLSQQILNRRCVIKSEFYALDMNGNLYLSNNKEAFAKNHNISVTSMYRCLNDSSYSVYDWKFFNKFPDYVLFEPVNVINELY